jgi:outer membrane protein
LQFVRHPVRDSRRFVPGFVRGLGAAALAVAIGGGVAAAETAPLDSFAGWLTGPWTVTLGVEGRARPLFEGADTMRFAPVPLFDIRRAGKARTFQAPLDGASIGLIETNNFRLGPTFRIRLPRKERDAAGLQGLGDVKYGVEVGGFAEYWPTQWLRTRGDILQGFHGHHGLVGSLSAYVVYAVTSQITLSAGPRPRFESGKTMQTYIGIDAQQSLLSGLPVYSPSGGFRSWGAGAQLRYDLTPQWSTHMFVEYERLSSSAADSPLVRLRGSRDQIITGIGINYAFDVGPLFR